MYVLSWRTAFALTQVLFWGFFPSLLCNSGNKHQNNLLVSAETIRHSSTYIILYIPYDDKFNNDNRKDLTESIEIIILVIQSSVNDKRPIIKVLLEALAPSPAGAI